MLKVNFQKSKRYGLTWKSCFHLHFGPTAFPLLSFQWIFIFPFWAQVVKSIPWVEALASILLLAMTVPRDTLLGAAPERLPCIAIGSVVSQSSDGSMLLAYRRGGLDGWMDGWMVGEWVRVRRSKLDSQHFCNAPQSLYKKFNIDIYTRKYIVCLSL